MANDHKKFVKKTIKNSLLQVTLGFVAEGNLYVFGKDNLQQAVIYFNFRVRVRSEEMDEFFEMVDAISLIVRSKACIPAYHEKTSIVIDFIDSKCSKSFIKMVKLYLTLVSS